MFAKKSENESARAGGAMSVRQTRSSLHVVSPGSARKRGREREVIFSTGWLSVAERNSRKKPAESQWRNTEHGKTLLLLSLVNTKLRKQVFETFLITGKLVSNDCYIWRKQNICVLSAPQVLNSSAAKWCVSDFLNCHHTNRGNFEEEVYDKYTKIRKVFIHKQREKRVNW